MISIFITIKSTITLKIRGKEDLGLGLTYKYVTCVGGKSSFLYP